MAFRYLLDPLFLICVGMYVVNRWGIEPWMAGSFFTNHLNDLICIPFCVPIMLFLLRRLRLRPDDDPPQACEIVLPLILWSVAFEVWLPTFPVFHRLATPDYRDVLFYAVGALVSGLWWNKYYASDCPTRGSATGTRPAPSAG